MANYVGNGYAWWIGQDGNIWANVGGNVQKLSRGSLNYSDDNGSYFSGVGISNGKPTSVKLYANNQIDDPNPPQKQAENPAATADNIYYSGSTGSSYSAEDAARKAEEEKRKAEEEATKARMREIYDRQIKDINNNVDSLDSQLKNDLDTVEGEYNQYKNEQQSSYDANKNDYDNSTLQNQQNLQTNRNEITNRASSGLRGLLRVLGAMGAGGGSVARYEAPSMVTKQANQEMSGAGRTYAQNQSSLDTDWGNYNNEFENDKKKLEDWYSGQVKSKKQANEERRQSLLNDLVTAYANRAQYGAGFDDNVDKTYNKINESRNRVLDLGKFTTPNYSGLTSVFKSPSLESYNTGNTDLSTTITDSNTSAASPLLVALQGLNKKKNNSPYNTERA